MRTFLILIVAVVMTLAARDGAGAQSFTSLQFSNATGSPVSVTVYSISKSWSLN